MVTPYFTQHRPPALVATLPPMEQISNDESELEGINARFNIAAREQASALANLELGLLEEGRAQAIIEAAQRDGVSLGFEDCYRSYNTQKSTYDKRCPIVETPVFGPDLVTGELVQIGSHSERVCSGPPIAKAGRSNHGWGRAVDFTDGRGILNCTDSTFRWMQGNAHRFGWVHPDWAQCGKSSQEPWHWEFAGVTDPTLVRFVTIDPTLIPALE